MGDRWLPGWGLGSVAFGGASLLVPLYVVELGGDAFALGVLFASASFVGVPGALLVGGLADRTGKRRVFVLWALVLTAAMMFAIPVLESILLVTVANALLWFGFAAATPVLTLLVVAGAPEARWGQLIARLNKYQGIGWTLGLALGVLTIAGSRTIVDPITGQRIFFGVCAVAAGIGVGSAARTLPPDPAPGMAPSPRRLRRRLRAVTRFNVRGAAFPFTPARMDLRALHPRRFAERFTPRLATYFLAVFLAFTGFGVFFAPLPAYLALEGFGTSEIFGLYLVLNVGAAVYYGRAAELSERYDLLRVHMTGLFLRAVALPVVAALGAALGGSLLGVGAVGLVFLLIGLTWAIIAVTATTLVTTLAEPSIRGEALGVYGSLIAVGGGAGGLLGGWLATIGYPVTFSVAGGLVITSVLVLFRIRRRADEYGTAQQ